MRINNDRPVAEFVTLVRVAEEAGFDQIWVSHDLMLRSAPVLVAAAAARTERIHLGIGIVNPYSVHPAELAMAAATLQEQSHGRFLLGLSAGAEDFLGWIGIERRKPLSRTREALRALRALLEGGRPSEVEGSGSGWTQQAHLRVPPSPTPIYLGAMSPRMLELAGAEADGVLPLLLPPEHLPTAAAHVSMGAARAGRDPDGVDLAACFWCSVADDVDGARRALAEKLAYYGPSLSPYLLAGVGLSAEDFDDVKAALERGDEQAAVASVTEEMLALGIVGGTNHVIDRCLALRDLGASHLSFGPPLGPDPVAALELLGSEVLPRLRDYGKGLP